MSRARVEPNPIRKGVDPCNVAKESTLRDEQRIRSETRDLPTDKVGGSLRRKNALRLVTRSWFDGFSVLHSVRLILGNHVDLGFFRYVDPAEANYQMDRQILLGQESTVVFAEDNRKKALRDEGKRRKRPCV
ncbi:hypothetical protein ZIOFF_054984 [Zingiber officinale]|uniref:Uncharacterized protein n=1 Tax=Zingiber officinale TaxID=94328 RepID=A0A8J5FEC4_ZINOF|nr:hypothetical protein ZIOFF_054984 [Zingiber officinale]